LGTEPQRLDIGVGRLEGRASAAQEAAISSSVTGLEVSFPVASSKARVSRFLPCSAPCTSFHRPAQLTWPTLAAASRACSRSRSARLVVSQPESTTTRTTTRFLLSLMDLAL